MKPKQTIHALMTRQQGRYSIELGIDLSSGRSRDIFRWFLASVLFGARISAAIVKKTYREFEAGGIASPKTIIDAGWDGLVEILDRGGYVRYDFKTATKLLDLCRSLTEKYDGDLANLHAAAIDLRDLEERLKALAKGIGEVTVNIFLREMRGIWGKADPLPSDLVVMAAKNKRIVSKNLTDRTKILGILLEAWKASGRM